MKNEEAPHALIWDDLHYTSKAIEQKTKELCWAFCYHLNFTRAKISYIFVFAYWSIKNLWKDIQETRNKRHGKWADVGNCIPLCTFTFWMMPWLFKILNDFFKKLKPLAQEQDEKEKKLPCISKFKKID